jgi:O-methyltransferase involved in polyketide biosynthesis
MFPPLARLSLNVPALRKFLMRQMFPPGIYEYTLARTKAMDEEFLDALESGFKQIVLLGAGFDTRALRFADGNHGTRGSNRHPNYTTTQNQNPSPEKSQVA